MLVLTRKVGETIMIGNEIEVTVVGIDRGRVMLGFKAPVEMRIDREEVRERINAKSKGARDANHEAKKAEVEAVEENPQGQRTSAGG